MVNKARHPSKHRTESRAMGEVPQDRTAATPPATGTRERLYEFRRRGYRENEEWSAAALAAKKGGPEYPTSSLDFVIGEPSKYPTRLLDCAIGKPEFYTGKYMRKGMGRSEERRAEKHEMRLAEIRESIESALKKEGVFVSGGLSSSVLLSQVLTESYDSRKIAVFARNKKVLGPISGVSVVYTDPVRAVEKLVALFRSKPVVEKALISYTRQGFNIALTICVSNAFSSDPETGRALRYALGVKNPFENPKKRI